MLMVWLLHISLGLVRLKCVDKIVEVVSGRISNMSGTVPLFWEEPLAAKSFLCCSSGAESLCHSSLPARSGWGGRRAHLLFRKLAALTG